MIRLKMKKIQYDINREAAKISTLQSGKMDKYEYFTGQEILSFNEKQIIKNKLNLHIFFWKSFLRTNKNN